MIKNKYLFFDLDNTLCIVNQQIKKSTIRLLKKLNKENQIIICSGKTTFYLSGLVRQLNDSNNSFNDLILIGENGANIQIGSVLPPEDFLFTHKNQEDIIQLKQIEKHLLEKFKDQVFLQPNLQTITFFVYDRNTIDLIKEELLKFEFKDYDIFIDTRSIDLMPKGMNKGTSVRYIQEKYHIDKKNCIGIGDNFNDLPMFKECGISISIGNTLSKLDSNINFNNINQALKYLIHKL